MQRELWTAFWYPHQVDINETCHFFCLKWKSILLHGFWSWHNCLSYYYGKITTANFFTKTSKLRNRISQCHILKSLFDLSWSSQKEVGSSNWWLTLIWKLWGGSCMVGPTEQIWTCPGGRGGDYVGGGAGVGLWGIPVQWGSRAWTGGSQVSKFEQVQVVVIWWLPPVEQTDTHDWKHCLPATSLAGGKYTSMLLLN